MKAISIPIGLGTSIILARALGPEGFGKYAFVMALVPILCLPLTGGMQSLLSREIAAYKISGSIGLLKGIIISAHSWVVLFSVIIVSCVLLYRETNFSWLEIDTLNFLSIAIFLLPMMGFSGVFSGAIKGLGAPAIAEISRMFVQPAVALCFLAFFFFRLELGIEKAILIQLVSASFGMFLVAILYVRTKQAIGPNVRAEYVPRYWLASLGHFFILALLGTFGAQVGIVLLGFLGNSEDVAALRVGERASQFVGMSITLVNLVIVPHIVKAHKENDLKKLQKLSRSSARVAFLIAAPIGLVLIFIGEPIIAVLFGGEYAGISYFPMLVLVVGQLFNVFFGSVGFLLAMTRNEKFAISGQLVSLMLNIFLCALLIPKYGAVGAAIGITISLIVWNLVLSFYVWTKVKIRPSII